MITVENTQNRGKNLREMELKLVFESSIAYFDVALTRIDPVKKQFPVLEVAAFKWLKINERRRKFRD